MQELVPIAAGGLVALALGPFAHSRTRWALLVAVSLLVGVAVSAAFGELARSWAFALWDAAQVLVAAVALDALGTLARGQLNKSG